MASPAGATVTFRTLHGRKESLQLAEGALAGDVLERLVARGIAAPEDRLVKVGAAASDGPFVAAVGDGDGGVVKLGDGDEVLILAAEDDERRAADVEDRPPPRKLTDAVLREASAHAPPSDASRSGVSEHAQSQDQPLGHLIEVVRHLLSISQTLQAALDEGDCDSADGGGGGGGGTSGEGGAGEAAAAEKADPYKDVDPQAVQMMVEMGFPEERSKKALALNHSEVEAAMEWLLLHDGDPDIDEPLEVPEARRTAGGGEFLPDAVAFRKLAEMGFGDADAAAALELSHNNFEVACDWLLSGRDVHAALERQHSQAVDGASPLITAVLADPHVQSCLVDARIRRALETLVVNPQNAAALMSDPIIRDVIIFLSQLIARVA